MLLLVQKNHDPESWLVALNNQSPRNTQKVPAASLSLPLNHTSLAGVKLLKELIPRNEEKNEKEIKLNSCLQRTPAAHDWFPCNLHLSPWNFFIRFLAQGHRDTWCCSRLEYGQEKKKHSLIYPWSQKGPKWAFWGKTRERFSFPCPGGKAQAIVHCQPRWKVSLLATLLDVKSWFTEKDPDAGKNWRQEEKRETEDEVVGWHHQLNGHEFEQSLGDSEGQRILACYSPRDCKESDMT